jgi:hypothetical protein
VAALRKFGSILLLALLFGYPAMACLTPGVEMTAAEHECCKRMAQMCGSMNMPNSHSCCQKEVRRPNGMLSRAPAHIVPPAMSEAVASASVVPKLAANPPLLRDLHPPPESPPSTSSILRV